MKNNPKILAFHLPQYHEIPENNEWWGKGFTDWVNVKKAKPLYVGHNQPRVPLNNNYYDMTDVDTIANQCKIAKEYGLYGFCYYHYWFNGKKLLEKPLDILLEHQEIDTNYCLCWANESWARTWDGKETDYLIKQEYSDKNDWIEHITYLYSFFQDERYIKINGHPMLLIYKTKSINVIDEMIDCFNNYLNEKGMPRIFLVEMLTGSQINPILDYSDACADFEPSVTGGIRMHEHPFITKTKTLVKKLKNIYLPKEIRKIFLDRVDYKRTVDQISQRNRHFDKPLFLGAFLGWDNTPRKGIGGTIYYNDTIENFSTLVKNQIAKAKQNNSEFIFINAWNEWAEGTYLEPDEKNGYGYLEAIKNIKEKL